MISPRLPHPNIEDQLRTDVTVRECDRMNGPIGVSLVYGPVHALARDLRRAHRGIMCVSPLLEVEFRQSFYAFARECDKLHRHNSDHVAHWQVLHIPLRFPLHERELDQVSQYNTVQHIH